MLAIFLLFRKRNFQITIHLWIKLSLLLLKQHYSFMFQFSKLAIFSIRYIFLIKCLSSIVKELLSDYILSLKLYITTYLSDAKLEI